MRAMSEFIESIAAGLRSADGLHRYLELGVRKGKTFNRVAPLVDGTAYAVDIGNSFDYIKNNHV